MRADRTEPVERLTLSIFDRSMPDRSLALAKTGDRLGYHRFWTSEHRAAPVSASPILLAAMAAAVTSRIRVGTAGIMLRYLAPYKVAEDFQLLEGLFPDRVDLGTIRGHEGAGPLDQALLDGRSADCRGYEDLFGQLVRAVRDGPGVDGSKVEARAAGLPQLWVCGLRAGSASMAAAHGVGLAYHRYIARKLGLKDGAQIVGRYRDEFRPAEGFDEPRVGVVCFGACGTSPAAAESIWRSVVGAASLEAMRPDFLGTPEACLHDLWTVAEEYGTGEIVVHCVGSDLQTQVTQYERLALAWREVGLAGSPR